MATLGAMLVLIAARNLACIPLSIWQIIGLGAPLTVLNLLVYWVWLGLVF